MYWHAGRYGLGAEVLLVNTDDMAAPFDPSVWGATAAAIASGIAGAVGGGMVVRRQLSRDATEIAHDKAEVSRIARLEAECEAAKAEAAEVRKRRTEDAEKIARLEAVNDFLEREMRMAMRGMTQEQRVVFDTDFAALLEATHSKAK